MAKGKKTGGRDFKPGNPGKKPKFDTDPIIMQRLESAIATGLSFKRACIYAGITENTYYNWMKKANEGDPNYIEIKRRLEKAAVDCEVQWLLGMEETGNKAKARPMWQSYAWRLERRFPDEWGKVEKVEHSGSIGIRPDEIINEIESYLEDETGNKKTPNKAR